MRWIQCAALLAALAAACSKGQDRDDRWVTDPAFPSLSGHNRYLLLVGTPHDPTTPGTGVACESCHGSNASFRSFECTGCHATATTDVFHDGVSGYPVAGAATSADCYRCHPLGLGVMTPEIHAQFFTIGTTSHPAVCTQCHADATRRADLSTLRCVICHATTGTKSGAAFSTAHARVNDYPVSATPDWCIRCHADDQVHPVASHGAFPDPAKIVEGTAGPGLPAGRHTNAGCLDCHTMIPPAFPNATGTPVPNRPWAQNWTVASCNKMGCH